MLRPLFLDAYVSDVGVVLLHLHDIWMQTNPIALRLQEFLKHEMPRAIVKLQ